MYRLPHSVFAALLTFGAAASAADVTIRIDTPMAAPRWAQLERQLLADNVPACREFFQKYFDERGYLQCFVRWGMNDGPDDAFENFNRWPELHALGASDEILQLYLKGHEGLLRQYSEAKTVDVPIAREGMYHKEFVVQSDWMHQGEGLQLFNRMGLSIPTDAKYIERARRFAGFYMDEDPEARNYDPKHKLIRSVLNGSRGPMLRPATGIEWAGDPFDVTGFDAVHRETKFEQFVAHYAPYTDVVGDSFLNLGATTLPTNAWLLTHDDKYRRWVLGYMDAWLERMRANDGIIPSYVDLEGRIGGTKGRWWGNVYGWGFSPVDPTNGRAANRNRIPRALVGFQNALLVSGNAKYVDAWRAMIESVNRHARTNAEGRTEYPTMRGDEGWYGWQDRPWSVGALNVWYWSQMPSDLARIGENPWLAFLRGENAGYPETALTRDLESITQRVAQIRADKRPPEKRLADNMLNFNPAATAALVQLMLGGLPPEIDGGLLASRLRYFDPARRRAGVPEDVAALVSGLSDNRTVVTLVNLSASETRTVIVQGGAYGEHHIESINVAGKATAVRASLVTIALAPGTGAKLELAMTRHAGTPTALHPWQR